MNSVLNVQVSCFRHCKAPQDTRPVNMLVWLRSAKHYNEQLRLRALAAVDLEQYRQEKIVKLPAVTPFAEFTYRKNDAFRNSEDSTSFSGLYCLDIDRKDNPHIENIHDLKQTFCKIKNVAYCGLSLSGNGYFLLIPITEPKRHTEYFEAFEKLFARWEIIIDPQCKDNSRLRIYSYDPEAYYNHQAEPVQLPAAKPKPQYRPPVNRRAKSNDTTSTQHKVEQLIEKINSSSIDITDGYQNWRALGFALVDEFGEGGCDYFHQISYHNGKYDHEFANRQFTDFLKHNQGHGGSKVTIGTFFTICQDFGIVYERPEKPKLERKSNIEPVRSKWDFPPIEIIHITKSDEQPGYPEGWDTIPGAVPSIRLIPSPNRFYYAEQTRISPDRVYSLARICESHN